MKLFQAIDSQTKKKLFVSLALKPGKTGETFYNQLFEYHGIDAEYRACLCEDLESDIQLVKKYCAGASITMPYKKSVCKLLDLNTSPNHCVNTVVNTDRMLFGYNCDLMGLLDLLDLQGKVLILGDGAMSENIQFICRDKKLDYTVVNRMNWDDRHQTCDVLVNATSIGMNGECPIEQLNAQSVVDCVIGNTELLKFGVPHTSGAEIYLSQLAHQFKIYTGIDADKKKIAEIAKQVFGKEYEF